MMAFHDELQDLDLKLSIGQINSIIKIRVKYLCHADQIVICTKENIKGGRGGNMTRKKMQQDNENKE